MNKSSILKIIKIAVGSMLAIMIASMLHLQYSTSAGI
ncbi:MAG TPA: aromatic acid exporter family protein, partial [Lachnospiraceae bacterium]|nr:aromatic acid exporter family protein [Lachnospiraceae bacterium]